MTLPSPREHRRLVLSLVERSAPRGKAGSSKDHPASHGATKNSLILAATAIGCSLGTAQDASRPPWSGKSCVDLAYDLWPGEHDWWVRVAADPGFTFGALSSFGNVVVEVGRFLVLCGNRGLLLRARVGKSCYLLASPRYARRQRFS